MLSVISTASLTDFTIPMYNKNNNNVNLKYPQSLFSTLLLLVWHRHGLALKLVGCPHCLQCFFSTVGWRQQEHTATASPSFTWTPAVKMQCVCACVLKYIHKSVAVEHFLAIACTAPCLYMFIKLHLIRKPTSKCNKRIY